MTEHWFYVPINPEPWAMGPLSMGRRGGRMFPKIGRNQQLHAYKEAVRSELADADPLPEGEYRLEFYFWRQIASYTDTGGVRRHRNVADTTNLQKATEDALQDVLFKNDRNVKSILSVIVEEGPEVAGQILIRAEPWYGFDPAILPAIAWDLIDSNPHPMLDWLPGDDEPF
jgi:Holliday junction resolvase RusA-like endonuclease